MRPARSAGHDRQGRREELLLNEELMRRVREEAQARLERVVALMEAGVQVLDPTTVYLDDSVTVGKDNVTVNASQLNESVVEDDVKIGPFAYIRPHCHVGKGVKVGDFVELKNSRIGAGTKISHLTYVGDSDVGSGVNFGCGTVTVNYDGTTKFRTTIGDGAFIGCNTNLVAPVRVGDGAYTAAGSTITEDVPDDSLAIARSMQVVKKQWAAKRRKR